MGIRKFPKHEYERVSLQEFEAVLQWQGLPKSAEGFCSENSDLLAYRAGGYFLHKSVRLPPLPTPKDG
jgi:hypothetical protein